MFSPIVIVRETPCPTTGSRPNALATRPISRFDMELSILFFILSAAKSSSVNTLGVPSLGCTAAILASISANSSKLSRL